MKLLFYSISTTLYGAPTSLLNLIQGLLEAHKTIKIFVVVPQNGPLTEELKKLPITVVVTPFYRWVYNNSLYNRKKKSNTLLAKLWFYKNVWHKGLLNLLWLPVHLLRISKIKPEVIYTNSSLSPMGIVVARIMGIKSVWHHRETINDPETDFFIEWSAKLARKVLNWPTAHIYPSRFLKDTYEPYVFTGDSHVVYNGVAVPATTTKKLFPDKSQITYGMVGRINGQKGQKEVIQRFANDNSHGKLFIYGSGEKSYVDSMTEIAPSDVVYFKGFESKAVIYTEIDFLIINARNESFGRVVAEAYSYGVPVLALRSGALPEIVDEGETGLIYDNMQQLKQQIEYTRELRNSTTYSKIRELCVKKYTETFTIGIYSQNILNILRELT